jgi:hypothetical protein
MEENEIEAIINIISLRRLIDGGAAIFIQIRRNHHIVVIGLIVKIPFVKVNLRLCVAS